MCGAVKSGHAGLNMYDSKCSSQVVKGSKVAWAHFDTRVEVLCGRLFSYTAIHGMCACNLIFTRQQ